MACIGKPSGTEVSLFEAVEHGNYDDPRQKSPLATTNSVLLNNGGAALAPMKDFNYALIAPATGYLYSGDTVTTGFYVGGTQIKLCKPGCRPRFRGAQLYHQTNAGTYYINRFTDGEVWVSTSPNVRSGTKISNSISSMVNPRGLRYIMLRIVGGGGKGANGTLLPIQRGGGGGGGATIVCCIKLPVDGYATVTVGGGSAASGVTCGTFYCTAGAGGNASGNSGGSGSASSGIVQTADGIWIETANGGAGGGAGNGGGGASISFADYAPEGGTVAWSQGGGGSGSGKAGGGGASTIGAGGAVANADLNTNGRQGSGPGAGGSGGNYSSGSGAAGMPGALTIWY